MIGPDKKVMLCGMAGGKLGGPVYLVREGGHWKIDAEGVIDLANRAMFRTAQTELHLLAMALATYERDVGKCPTAEQGLRALVESPADESIKRNWKGPYLEGELPLDPWGTPFRYSCPGIHNPTYDVFSCGPDKQEGGGDDIGNW